MKKLLGILVLILFTLQTPSQADDISDFQIEGMSVGDSLLDYLSKDKIKKIKSPNKKIKYVRANVKDGLKIYDNVQVWWKEDDTEYIIAAIAGNLLFENNINACKKKQKEIGKYIHNLFPNLQTQEAREKNMNDKTGKSFIYHLEYLFPNGDVFNIQCYDFSKDMKTKYGRKDNLKSAIFPKKWSDHFKNAYK